jgi:hypothetical protein
MAVAVRYRIDIENSSGVVQGSGPITSATFFEAVNEMDRAGTFSFGMSAADPQSSVVTERNIARCYAILNDTWTEIGAGVIDSIVLSVGDQGDVQYLVSGLGIPRELSQRSVRNLELASAGTFITHSAALDAIDDFAPAGWTITPAASPANDNVYGRFAGASVLSALIAVAEKTRTHFYYNGSRELVFADSFADSGVRAVQARGDLASGICAITNLQRIYDTFDLKTRIIPYGAGQGDTRLTLSAATRTPVAGYTLDTANNYIENDSATATYGLDEIALEFKDIQPISNTDADVQAAMNSLYDAAYEWLRRHSVRGEFYDLTLSECDTVLRPMQTIHVDYRDERQDVDINTNLNILSATVRVDLDGLRTTRLTVASLDRWAENDTTGYTKNVDDTETATIRFRFGDEVTQLQQVLLEFQLLQFESTIKTVALESMTGGSGELITEGNSDASSTPSNDTSGTPSTANTSVPSTNTSGAASGNTGSSSGSTGVGSGTIDAGGTSPTDSGGTATTDSGGDVLTGAASGTTGGNSDDTSGAKGGEVDGAGQHFHDINIFRTASAGSLYPMYTDSAATLWYVNASGTSPIKANTLSYGEHTHDLAAHTHSMNNHTHSMGSHTHTIAAHTHAISTHTHTIGTHTHTGGSHTHDLNAHTHSLNNHTHDLGNHTHTLSNHTHTLNNHQHTLTPTIITTYGIFRETLLNTYGIADLEYRVNSGAWTDLSTATDVGSSWYQLDLTAALYNATSFRPLQTANTWQVRKKAAAAAGKTVTVDLLLSVRNIVQGIAYTI